MCISKRKSPVPTITIVIVTAVLLPYLFILPDGLKNYVMSWFRLFLALQLEQG